MRQVKTATAALGILIVMFIMMAATCQNGTGANPVTMSPKQQASVWMNVYIAAYDDTLAMALNPNATPAQKAMVVKKKAILAQIWGPLKLYISIVDSGGTPTPAATTELFNLINQLSLLAGGV